jgi:uncharacterized protein (DUF1501 family)
MLTRRHFLRAAGALPLLVAVPPPAKAGPDFRRVLLLVELKGGNDGLNTLIPHADPLYARLRPGLAVAGDSVLALDERLGLHPSLAPLMPAWAAGDLAVVAGLGYPQPNRSHFRSIEIWDTAADAGEELAEGWIARLFAAYDRPDDLVADGIVVDNNPLPVTGRGMRGIVLRDAAEFVAQADTGAARVGATGNPALDHILAVQRDIDAAARRLGTRMRNAPAPQVEYDDGLFGRQLDLATSILLSRTPVAVIKVAQFGFDTHANQAREQRRQLAELARGLAAFRANMIAAGLWDEVTVMTYSEFGRRVAENGSGGTDHGTAAPHFVLGGRVRGGLHGRQPRLDDLENGDLRFAVDFRSLYGAVARDWWGLDHAPVTGGRIAPLSGLLI